MYTTATFERNQPQEIPFLEKWSTHYSKVPSLLDFPHSLKIWRGQSRVLKRAKLMVVSSQNHEKLKNVKQDNEKLKDHYSLSGSNYCAAPQYTWFTYSQELQVKSIFFESAFARLRGHYWSQYLIRVAAYSEVQPWRDEEFHLESTW